MKNIVFLTGSGISKESGIPTFRDSGDGLWNNVSVEEVATIDGYRKDPEKVINFYNDCREQMKSCRPNAAHQAIADLQKDPDYYVTVFTQNVDNLHEEAGAKNVYHLHGDIAKGTSSEHPWRKENWKDLEGSIKIGDTAADGSQLRPCIVWFGEEVQCIRDAERIISNADALIVCGTSLQVYPAAGLVDMVSNECKVYIVDPNVVPFHSAWGREDPERVCKPASTGIPDAISRMKAHFAEKENL